MKNLSAVKFQGQAIRGFPTPTFVLLLYDGHDSLLRAVARAAARVAEAQEGLGRLHLGRVVRLEGVHHDLGRVGLAGL